MEEIEVPTEHLHEKIHENIHSPWTLQVALSSALLAVLAAITALLAGHHANDAMIEQIQASDQWAYYQAKGIKSAILNTKIALLEASGKKVDIKDKEKAADYKKEQKEIEESAHEKEVASREHFKRHSIFARGVTLFQIGIAVSAISVLTRRKKLWYTSLLFGVIGIGFLLQGLF